MNAVLTCILHKLNRRKRKRDHLVKPERCSRRDTGSWSRQTGKGSNSPSKYLLVLVLFCRLGFLHIPPSHFGIFFLYFCLWLFGCGWSICCRFTYKRNANELLCDIFAVFLIKCINLDPHTRTILAFNISLLKVTALKTQMCQRWFDSNVLSNKCTMFFVQMFCIKYFGNSLPPCHTEIFSSYFCFVLTN